MWHVVCDTVTAWSDSTADTADNVLSVFAGSWHHWRPPVTRDDPGLLRLRCRQVPDDIWGGLVPTDAPQRFPKTWVWQSQQTLTRCWYNVGPPSATLAQHCTNIGWMSRVAGGTETNVCPFYHPLLLLVHPHMWLDAGFNKIHKYNISN